VNAIATKILATLIFSGDYSNQWIICLSSIRSPLHWKTSRWITQSKYWSV